MTELLTPFVVALIIIVGFYMLLFDLRKQRARLDNGWTALKGDVDIRISDELETGRAEMKDEIISYLRDCAADHGATASESRILNRAADNVERGIVV